MNKDIKDLSDYKEDLKSLKEVKSFMNSYTADSAVTDKRIKLLETDIKT
jgi:hypothetical protein